MTASNTRAVLHVERSGDIPLTLAVAVCHFALSTAALDAADPVYGELLNWAKISVFSGFDTPSQLDTAGSHPIG
jgi:hypothetical protein